MNSTVGFHMYLHVQQYYSDPHKTV